MHEIPKGTEQAVPSTNQTSRPKTFVRKPSPTKVSEIKIVSEQEQAAEEKDAPRSGALGRRRRKCTQDDSDGADSGVRSAEAAFFAGWCLKQKTADIRKARGFQETSLSPSTNSGSKQPGGAGDDGQRDQR